VTTGTHLSRAAERVPMSALDDLPAIDGPLDCVRCGDAIDRGYVTAGATADGYAMDEAGAVCDVCGWNEVGATGCAPTLADFDGGDLLVRVEPVEGSIAPVDVTDEG